MPQRPRRAGDRDRRPGQPRGATMGRASMPGHQQPRAEKPPSFTDKAAYKAHLEQKRAKVRSSFPNIGQVAAIWTPSLT